MKKTKETRRKRRSFSRGDGRTGSWCTYRVMFIAEK